MPEYIARDPRTPEEGRLGDALLEALETVLEMPRDLKVPTDPLAAILRDVVVAAGWRPPARVITDLAELDGLPPCAVIRAGSVIYQHVGYGVWLTPGVHPRTHSVRLLQRAALARVQVIVLWTPRQDGQAEDAQIEEGDRG
ncbi:hypothetical protein [Nocardia farcinica]|uniref:hypothetical protein n=1 Tax=Nocardia farcinica TaxID=37329 RepID=UPI0024562679|nr:hypothetical protein [Nocardia farcinica]